MLTPAQMQAVDADHTGAHLTLLWTDYMPDGTGPNLLTRFLRLCRGCDDYLHDALFHPDMDTTLRAAGRDDFRPIPSQTAIIGMMMAWAEFRKVLVAEATFDELTAPANRPEGAAERFQPMRAALVWFRMGLDRDVRTAELRSWLDAIGWPELLQQAEARDHAARALIAGRAFVSAQGDIAAIPTVRPGHAAA
ncbi:hypothetical protein HLH36_02630 [Gluconacetobacter aggeris]|uniref:Uncharacterized protein n=1 Tax=Gluconacetobacter aggeris TaxID=1286186 RepID=A0A7W4NV62_9PROT|nr:hypothetical protein [Gluconacetobacter aggeris]MBB2167262.1 hypothetical protein [Gluconacetobacter aggeris]